MEPGALASWLLPALHSLAEPPAERPWNLHELDGLPLPLQASPAAVLVGIIPRPTGAGVLLTRRNERMRQHAGQVSFPGGRIEPADASPAAAALREAHEEVGLDAGQARALGYLDPLLTITGYRVLPLLALIDPGFVARPDPSEVAEVFEVPLSLLLDPASLEQVELRFGGLSRHVFQYRYEQQRIWGVTASILFNLRQRLANASQGRA